MLGQAAALLRPGLCASHQSFLLPQPAGQPIAAIDAANEHLLVPTQLPLGVRVASVPAELLLAARRGCGGGSGGDRISVIVMPTGHLMLADLMALPAAALLADACGPQPQQPQQQPESLVKMEAAVAEDDQENNDEEEDEDDDDDEGGSKELVISHRRKQQHPQDDNVVDGVDLNEIGQFARDFKLRRLRLGLTQSQIGAALSAAKGPAYSQSAISRFEKLDVTPRSAARIKQALQLWLQEAEDAAAAAAAAAEEEAAADTATSASKATPDSTTSPPVVSSDGGKRPRKRRTSFTPEALDALNCYFELKRHPSGAEVTQLARSLRYSREVVRVWFCNRRQALRANTVKRLRPPQQQQQPHRQFPPHHHHQRPSPPPPLAAARPGGLGLGGFSASSPSPADSPVNLSQQQELQPGASTMPADASPKSEHANSSCGD